MAEARKVAIVTGAGTGIGAAAARRLAARGYAVALVGRRASLLDAVTQEIVAAGGTAIAIAADIGDAAQPGVIVAKTVEAFGRIDALVNNAATIKVLPLAEYGLDILDQHWAVNLRGPFLLIQAALPHLTASKGAVVNISSSSATLVRPGQSVYGMTKAGLEYLTRSLAGEFAATGIRFNCLAFGPIDTPIHETWATDLKAAYEWLKGQVPLGRIGSADEAARWIEILVTEDAGWMTGAIIPLDGGQVLDIA
jgi:NAD(P)-dependent dehydrogenase (short-subunit alcohol dehydrogenase family)